MLMSRGSYWKFVPLQHLLYSTAPTTFKSKKYPWALHSVLPSRISTCHMSKIIYYLKIEYLILYFFILCIFTLTIFNSNNQVRHFINRLKANSVLNFTFDKMTGNCFNFLDWNFESARWKICNFSFHFKPTDKRVYMIYNAFSPEM